MYILSIYMYIHIGRDNTCCMWIVQHKVSIISLLHFPLAFKNISQMDPSGFYCCCFIFLFKAHTSLILISWISLPNSRVFLKALHNNLKKAINMCPWRSLFCFFFFSFFFLACLSLPSSETEQEYVHKGKNSIVYTDQYRLGSEGEKTKHLLNTNEASRLVC